jgi:hypothetical protein
MLANTSKERAIERPLSQSTSMFSIVLSVTLS